MTVVDFYRTDLRVYGHLSIARIHRSKSFHERIDGSLLLLVRECPKLTTLVGKSANDTYNDTILQ